MWLGKLMPLVFSRMFSLTHMLLVAYSHSFICKCVSTEWWVCGFARVRGTHGKVHTCIWAKLASGSFLTCSLLIEEESLSNPEVPCQLAQGICCLLAQTWDFRWLSSMPRIDVGSGHPGSLRSPLLYHKCFIHWDISPAPPWPPYYLLKKNFKRPFWNPKRAPPILTLDPVL